MPKAAKYYSEEELDKKIEELQALKAKKEKDRIEKLNLAKIAYVDSLFDLLKERPENKQGMKKRCEQIKTKLSPRKDKKIIEGLNELIKEIDNQPEVHLCSEG